MSETTTELTPEEAGAAYAAMQNLRALFPDKHSSERFDAAEAKLYRMQVALEEISDSSDDPIAVSRADEALAPVQAGGEDTE